MQYLSKVQPSIIFAFYWNTSNVASNIQQTAFNVLPIVLSVIVLAAFFRLLIEALYLLTRK